MTPAGTRWGTTGAVIVIVVICLAGLDNFLARVESAETRNTAQQSFLMGSRLVTEGKAGAAVDFLRDANNLERKNPDYELQLIAALTAAGETTEAEPLLADILQREPNDGRANLIGARLMTREGKIGEAEAYYHRTVYGEWPGNAGARRVSARMELIELLAGKNQKQELLAELISLEADAPATREIQNRLGALFLLAGSPARAANVYEALVRTDPTDIEAYEKLGDAELQQSQYRAAHETYLRAFLRAPNNESARAHLVALNTVTGLDPTLRQLTSAEKYRRSIRILEMTREALDQCATKEPSAGSTLSSGGDSELRKTAKAIIAGKAPAHATNEAAEGVLSLAEKFWQTEMASCGGSSSDQSALDLIMKKLTS
jgi:tetratricopeptide (TPR) repeat protein